ncbi:hypothetical protein EMCRGX_G016045 [Ephydatia muelleri]
MSSTSPVGTGAKDAVVPEGEREATPTSVTKYKGTRPRHGQCNREDLLPSPPEGELDWDDHLHLEKGGDGGMRGSRQVERNKPRTIIIPNPELKVKLRKAEQPWQRQAALKLELTDKQKETLEVLCKFRSILNKLTPQKFQKLADATLQLKINTEERLRGVVDLIFTRAITETMYSEVYANLCRVLAPLAVETVNAEGKPQTVNFRRLLLTKCQQEFEKDMQEDEERETMQKGVETAETEEMRKQQQMELEAAEMASRHQSLGNIRFIGELYKLKILSDSIIHECMIRLLKSASDEGSLECFTKLMTVTGKELDKEEAKLRIDTYFSRVNDVIKKGKISKRVKFALQDVVDLRNNKWVPRKRQDTKVKTIDQIHREAQDEEDTFHA